MKKIFLGACMLFCVGFEAAYAGPLLNYESSSLHDVVVPTVWGTPTGGDLIQGMMYFDAASSSLKFVGPSATPITIGSTADGNIVSNDSSQRLEHAFISNSGSPSVTRQSGTWISVTTDNSTGDTTFAIAGFSAAPSCVCTVYTSLGGDCFINSTTAVSSTVIRVQTVDTGGSAADRDFNIHCMGAR